VRLPVLLHPVHLSIDQMMYAASLMRAQSSGSSMAARSVLDSLKFFNSPLVALAGVLPQLFSWMHEKTSIYLLAF
jgi:hypothetical protein